MTEQKKFVNSLKFPLLVIYDSLLNGFATAKGFVPEKNEIVEFKNTWGLVCAIYKAVKRRCNQINFYFEAKKTK